MNTRMQTIKTARRASRKRSSIKAKSTRNRLSIYRSNLNIYAQIIDDSTGTTLAAANTLDKEFKKLDFKGTGLEIAHKIGVLVAERAIKAGIKEVVYDTGSYAYHGRVKQLADGARSIGLKF